MKCPHCQERLGINNICINPTCSYFGTEMTNSVSSNTTDNNATTIPNNNSKSNTNNNYNNTTDEYSNISNNKLKDINSNNYQQSTYSTETSNNTTNKSRLRPNINDISDEEFLEFFGDKNAEFYLRQANTYRLNTKFTNWNWASFFLTFYWLLYRKLYGIAFAYLAIDIITAFLGPASLIMRIVLGFYGNNIYLKAAEKKIRSIRLLENNISREEYLMRIREQGGTNIIAPLAFIFAFIIIILLIVVFGAVMFSSVPEIHQGFYYY